ncbi:MAG: Ig-like domain-containing protein, partial [Patescibacteria group bacterium]
AVGVFAGKSYGTGNYVDAGWSFGFDGSGTGGTQFSVSHTSPYTDLRAKSAANLFSLNQWQHVTVTWDGSSNAQNVHIYHNGQETLYQVQQNGVTNPDSDSPVAFILGSAITPTQQGQFNGSIDDVRIYNRVLTVFDVQTLYNLASGPPDTTPPAVSITAPTSGSTVSGSSVIVSANASDNIGVGGVQFKLDGLNLGTEDTTSPYSITWNTAATTNGSLTLTATARDAAGNQTTSTGVPVTVSNATSDTQAPSTPTNLQASAVSSSQINLSWTASTDNVGVTGYRVERCQGTSCTTFTQIAIPSTTSYNDTGLTANTTYRYQVRAQDAAGNLSGYSSVVSATTQPSSGSTALQAFINTMSPGTWGVLSPAPTSKAAITARNDAFPCYSDAGAWNPVARKWMFAGACIHGAPVTFAIYDEVTNSWSLGPPLPS